MNYQVTSRMAYDHGVRTGKFRQHRSRILQTFYSYGQMTCDRLEQVLGMSHQTASASICHLKNEGLLHDTGKKEPTRTGRKAIVWSVHPPKPQFEMFN